MKEWYDCLSEKRPEAREQVEKMVRVKLLSVTRPLTLKAVTSVSLTVHRLQCSLLCPVEPFVIVFQSQPTMQRLQHLRSSARARKSCQFTIRSKHYPGTQYPSTRTFSSSIHRLDEEDEELRPTPRRSGRQRREQQSDVLTDAAKTELAEPTAGGSQRSYFRLHNSPGGLKRSSSTGRLPAAARTTESAQADEGEPRRFRPPSRNSQSRPGIQTNRGQGGRNVLGARGSRSGQRNNSREEEDEDEGVARRGQDRGGRSGAHPEFGDVDPMDKDGYSFLDDHFSDQFSGDMEKRGYGEAMEQTSVLLDRLESVEKLQKGYKKDKNTQTEVDLRCEEELQDIDKGIIKALEAFEDYRDKNLTPHKPESIDLDDFYRRNIGAVAAGPGGNGMVLEDGLRYLSNREGHKFKYPKDLARRLMAGDFVKFKSHTERREVVEAIQQLANEKDAPKELKSLKFTPLDPAARKDVANRLVQGRSTGDQVRQGDLIEAGKMKGPQDVLDTATRLTGGHYNGTQMQTVLQTIGEMLPSGSSKQTEPPSRR